MSKLGLITVAGRSGNRYNFRAYPLETAFRKGLGAVYVVTRRRQVQPDGGFKHKRIGMDQTDDLRGFLTGGERLLAARGVNCICVHGEKDQAARRDIRRDLLRGPRPASHGQ